MPTDEVTARIHTWLGTWSPGQKCEYCQTGLETYYQAGDVVPTGIRHVLHDIPMPPLTKADAVSCLEKLRSVGYVELSSFHSSEYWSWRMELYINGKRVVDKAGLDPTEAIFAATDAYIVSTTPCEK